MRIAVVAPNYAPEFEGGTETVARAQARELAALGHDVRVVAGSERPHRGEDVAREVVDGVPVARVPRLATEPYELALDRPRVRALVEAEVRGCDAVHVHHWATLDGGLVRSLSRAAPVVVTLHDSFATCPRFFRVPVPPVSACPGPGDVEPCVRCLAPDAGGTPPEVLAAGLAARAEAFSAELAAAARLVAPSRSHARGLARLLALDPDAIEVVPHGLCRPVQRVPPPRTGPGVELRVLHLGHRTEVKGTLELARAAGTLPEASRARVVLLLAGEEVASGFDARVADAARGARIRRLGRFEGGGLTALLSEAGGAHLAAFPSRVEESYGLAVDEALALGVPVWVSDRGAPPERVGAAGRVLPAGDPDAWARALAEVLERPGALAAERAAVPERLPTAADAARALERLYSSVRRSRGGLAEGAR